MPSPSAPSIVILLTLLAFPACAPGGAAPPDVREAERELGRAVSELEEIAGPRLLRREPPPLPEVSPVDLSPEVNALTTRLEESDPAEWAPDDRARLAEVLARRMSLQPGTVGPLLGNAVFLLTVPDLQRIAVRPETAEATLERLDALRPLLTWDLPGAAGPASH